MNIRLHKSATNTGFRYIALSYTNLNSYIQDAMNAYFSISGLLEYGGQKGQVWALGLLNKIATR